MRKDIITKIIQTIGIAAAYVILTYVSKMFGMANGIFRIRISEALMVLPFFTPAAIPGLFIGSLISNYAMSPLTAVGASGATKLLYEVLIESGATLVSAFISYFIGKRQKFAVPFPPIIINALTIPFVYNVWLGFDEHTLLASIGLVAAGEFITCGVLGIALMLGLEDYKDKLFPQPGSNEAAANTITENNADKTPEETVTDKSKDMTGDEVNV